MEFKKIIIKNWDTLSDFETKNDKFKNEQEIMYSDENLSNLTLEFISSGFNVQILKVQNNTNILIAISNNNFKQR